MTPEEAKQVVLSIHPDAIPCENDYYTHWIGLPSLSEGFEEDRDALDAALSLPYGTDEELIIHRQAVAKVEQGAIDKAWIDAAARLQDHEL